MKYIFSICFCLLLSLGAQAQVMWPGDANNSGKVNAVDLLFVGLAYNAKGPARSNASTQWQGQNFTPWSQFFPNGLNYAYADGNGDGEIDDDDLDDAIERNFGLEHGTIKGDGFVRGQKGQAPQLKLSTTQNIVAPGATIEIDLVLGDATQNVSTFYGIAVQMAYTSRLVRSSNFEDENSPWFEGQGEDTEDFYISNAATGLAELAITRKNQQSISGFGRMGKIKLVIEDIIVGKPVDTLRITIDSVLLVNQNFQSRAVAHDTLVLYVTSNPELVGTQEIQHNSRHINIYPNPSTGDFWVKSPLVVQQWELFDPLGRAVPIRVHADLEGQWKIQPQHQVSGIYQLRGRSAQGLMSKSIVLTSNSN